MSEWVRGVTVVPSVGFGGWVGGRELLVAQNTRRSHTRKPCSPSTLHWHYARVMGSSRPCLQGARVRPLPGRSGVGLKETKNKATRNGALLEIVIDILRALPPSTAPFPLPPLLSQNPCILTQTHHRPPPSKFIESLSRRPRPPSSNLKW